ncbi:hypothetical protein GQ53DRAFT_751775 [Thozetella sp. PMI_491]|nr:hypothetical protein GQ53DRAFT_751775 [Thozetella sp. PMI_491]
MLVDQETPILRRPTVGFLILPGGAFYFLLFGHRPPLYHVVPKLSRPSPRLDSASGLALRPGKESQWLGLWRPAPLLLHSSSPHPRALPQPAWPQLAADRLFYSTARLTLSFDFVLRVLSGDVNRKNRSKGWPSALQVLFWQK